MLCLSPGPGLAEGQHGTALISEARAALAKGDGIKAEMTLRAALTAGAPRTSVAAFIGEAYLAQGNRVKAREWLGASDFTPTTAEAGYRALGRLERLDGHFDASARAYDKALAIDAKDASLWVEIGRLRYAAGQHLLAIEAADHALTLDPGNVAALQFRGQLVRDRYGLMAALPWFENALMRDPKDIPVLLDYAATLGDLGRAGEALVITRRVLEIEARNPRAYYLQAVMAARAGKYELARGLLARTRGKLDGEAGVLLLRGIVELAAGNWQEAQDRLERLLTLQPDNARAKDVLARAIYLGGQYRYATLRFSREIARGEGSPYLLTLVARAHEALGERDRAGVLLDRAAMPKSALLQVLPGGTAIGGLLAQGEGGTAEARIENAQESDPGFYDNMSLAGDVQLALGHPVDAQARYAAAAEIRMPESLFLRRFQAFVLAGDLQGANLLVRSYMLQNPTNRRALRAAAWLSLKSGEVDRARGILEWLRETGSGRDVQLLSDLAVLEAQAGNAAAAQTSAARAYRLQRANPLAAQALGLSYVAGGVNPEEARALIDKARTMMGDNPMLAAARQRLALARG